MEKSGWSKYSVRQHGKYGIPVNIDIAVFFDHRLNKPFIYACFNVRHLKITKINGLYRCRFAIESSYRQAYQAFAKTASRSPVLRFFFFGIALILRNVWVYLNLYCFSKKIGLHFQLLLDWIVAALDCTFPLQQSITVSISIPFNLLRV